MTKLISIITPVLNEAQNLNKFVNVVKQELIDNNKHKFEVILVDDGSKDNSWDIIKEIVKQYPEFNAIRLSRNMGAHTALSAGFMHVNGDAVVILACDLQDPPSVINEFINQWEQGNEVVWGARKKRQDKAWVQITSKMFEFLLRKWVLPKGSLFTTGSFLLIDRKVIGYFNQFTEHNRITFAIVAWLGFKQVRVYYNRQSRQAGKSGWTFIKMTKALYDAVIGFAYAPVRFISIFSFFVFLLTIPFAGYVLYLYFAGRTDNMGWISTILTVFGFGSLILFNTALILEYLARIHSNTTRRPIYFIAEKIGLNNEQAKPQTS